MMISTHVCATVCNSCLSSAALILNGINQVYIVTAGERERKRERTTDEHTAYHTNAYMHCCV